MSPAEVLTQWLERQLDSSSFAWLQAQLADVSAGSGDQDLAIAWGMAPRKLGKADLRLNDDDMAVAGMARTGFNPVGWTIADAARILLLLATAENDVEQGAFAERFKTFCTTADVAEAITLYRGLPLYPSPESLQAQVGEGLRTNIRAVFEAIAHHNPYPHDYFDDHRWNHMVLKALFVDSRLAPIYGLDDRANANLARIMRDFAHERWAAGRVVPFEIWRCVGPFADSPDAIADLERALNSTRLVDRSAAALALAASPDPAAAKLLATQTELSAAVAAGDIAWQTLTE